MTIEQIGCCGAYCRTCKVYTQKLCAGCKIGYTDGKRDISKARCKIKVCCIKKGHDSCADCSELNDCKTAGSFYLKKGYKYGKYKEAVLFIKTNGNKKFLKIADEWKNAYGKLK